jgi:hypothetical protein
MGKNMRSQTKGYDFSRVSEDVRKRISDIKETRGKEELNDLLKHVYITYPDFTVNSEILRI